jgi:hypothetical protein
MGTRKPGFLRKFFKRAHRFGKKRGFQESERFIQLTVDLGQRPLPGRKRIGVMNSLLLISPDRAWGFKPILSGKSCNI